MSKLDDNRVLGRMGARVITTEEAKSVKGGSATTQLCTIISATGTVTGSGDGDGCSDTDTDHPFA
jgi:hypothetical protein